ncbi:MAG: aminotransferase class V-fold PLP-dependent enzyme [Planctomycetes bacterium]|nr:aminotransferase class V-fold PLP-dependent enzyme [Planctomycetota bacterium]
MHITRRTVLKVGALGAALTGDIAAAADGPATQRSIYEALGVEPIINAAGTITTLGGSLMPPEVVAAWTAASQSFVDLLELQDRVGEKIARLLNVEAAMVTTGAAGGIVLGTAAAVTYRDRDRIGRLPLPPEMGLEVIRQRTHRACYDNQVQACGVRLVDVETREDLERAINERTAMMFSYNVNEQDGQISQREWVAVARKHGIPTLLDAAADTPPLDALWKYNQLGFDMVAFSGGKAIRGPQDAGLLLGRKDLIEAAKLNTAPRCGTIGRGMKVSKEDMVAMWAAVERYVHLDHEAERREWERRIGVIEHSLAGIPTVQTRRITPPIANQVPHLLILWDEERLKLTPAQMKQRLAEGKPSIATARVHGTGEEGFLISVFMLQPGEDEIVAVRVRELLSRQVQ